MQDIGIPWHRMVRSVTASTTADGSASAATIVPEPNVHGLPQRNVRFLSKTAVRGSFSSTKMGRQIETEGILETYSVPFLELDTSITAYLEQPVRIYFLFNGKKTRYTPDFLVLYKDGSLEIIELKPSEKLDNNEIEFFHVVYAVLRSRNIKFRILHEKDIRDNTLFNNVSFLDYIKRAPMSSNAWQAYVAAQDRGAYEELNALSWIDWLALVARGLIRVPIDVPLKRQELQT